MSWNLPITQDEYKAGVVSLGAFCENAADAAAKAILAETFFDGGLILDLGIGAGRWSYAIAQRVPSACIVGVDGMAELAPPVAQEMGIGPDR